MQKIRQVQDLNRLELQNVISPNASWHTDYRDTSYIFIGGLPFSLSEGDLVTIFSQYGEPVWVKLARDKDTGKSRGFGWLKYEDQRSCDLAVDNLGGAEVLGRKIGVDHARYKKREDEDMSEGVVRAVGEESDHEDVAVKRVDIDGRRRRRSETPKMVNEAKQGRRRSSETPKMVEDAKDRRRRRSETPKMIEEDRYRHSDRRRDPKTRRSETATSTEDEKDGRVERRRRRSSTRSDSPDPDRYSRRRRRRSTTRSDSSEDERRYRRRSPVRSRSRSGDERRYRERR